VKSYFALKLTGDSPNAEHMQRAKAAILQAGGVEQVNSFTRYYLALLGILSYDQCPAVPPELMLIPKWMPFNIYEMSAWSRTILVPLSLLWAYQPVKNLPDEFHIDEIFIGAPEDLTIAMLPTATLDQLSKTRKFNWRSFFQVVDRGIKTLESMRCKPLRQHSINKAAQWMIERFENSDGLGAIFPPIIWSVVALKCLGHDEDSPLVQNALNELKKLQIREGNTLRLQPCKSPVWDTAISTIALRDSGVPAEHPAMKLSVKWLLSKEVRNKGDWSARNPKQQTGGWFFEFENAFYPDVDDTAMVVLALSRCVPAGQGSGWLTDYLLDPNWSPHETDREVTAALAGRNHTMQSAYAEIESMRSLLGAIHRGASWAMSMQSKDGGWGAFDADNNRELFTQVPFADHNAMIDPSSADLTARMLEMLAALNVEQDNPQIQRALDYIWSEQEHDACWYGRWGVNYIYGTWQTVVGLTEIGIPTDDIRIQRAANWLKSTQQKNGGWGETVGTYDDPSLRGTGETTASQTAWALMGLMASGETHSPEVQQGIDYLTETQLPDGTWDENWFTGTGFPKVFYLKYHLYRIYFPLMALGRYAKVMSVEKAETV
jgi:squalene-hopene/tetraprenyl-beta-curcumene cyclase